MTRDDIIRMAREAGFSEKDTGHLVDIYNAISAAEREACARVCEELELKSADGEWGTYVAGWSDGTDDCAAAIRARGQGE